MVTCACTAAAIGVYRRLAFQACNAYKPIESVSQSLYARNRQSQIWTQRTPHSSALQSRLTSPHSDMAPAWLEKFIVREDATPDPRRSSDQPTLELHYTATSDHRRILRAGSDTNARYEIERKAIAGAWGSKIHISLPNAGKEVATIDFHGLPRPRMEIEFPQRQKQIMISLNKREVDIGGGLGSLHWKGTGMKVHGEASWELRDNRDLVMAVEIDDKQSNGVISLWRDGLSAETEEELVIVGIAQIEEYKRMLRNAKTSKVGVKAVKGADAVAL